MKTNDFNYWIKEIKNNFPHRAKLDANNFFVISYMVAPPPCNVLVHEIMNFSDFGKIVSFIQNILVRRAVGDTLDLDYDDAMSGNFDDVINDFCKDNELTRDQKEAIALYRELDHLLYAPADIAKQWLKDFRYRFEKLFDHCANCVFGLEIVFPEESLVDFWKYFFRFDMDEECCVEEINELQNALDTGDADLLSELISNH